jgi:hypothetical protein
VALKHVKEEAMPSKTFLDLIEAEVRKRVVKDRDARGLATFKDMVDEVKGRRAEVALKTEAIAEWLVALHYKEERACVINVPADVRRWLMGFYQQHKDAEALARRRQALSRSSRGQCMLVSAGATLSGHICCGCSCHKDG